MKTLLVSLSAKNIHKSLAVWSIKAYCDEKLREIPGYSLDIAEHSINESTIDILAEIVEGKPDIVGFSCYIWNIELVRKLVRELEKCLPDLLIILGGPEIIQNSTGNNLIEITGVGEKAFCDILCKRFNVAGLPDCIENFALLPSPYTEEFFQSFEKSAMLSIANQLVYYESSRGCPYSCAYCLSSMRNGVEFIPVERVKHDLEKFVFHGAKCIKFVDRTFNADKKRAKEILEYILALDTDCTFHFEVGADLFDGELLEIVRKMPACRVQFEIGIQSINKCTLEEVSRKSDLNKALQNIKLLTELGNTHIHVDLIAGLPHETAKTFAQAIDKCLELKPHMLQVGFLKILKGSEMEKLAAQMGYIYTSFAPYEVLKSNSMDFKDLRKIKEIEVLIDKYYNSGKFANTVGFAIELFGGYEFFSRFSEFKGSGFKASLKNAYTLLANFLLNHAPIDKVFYYIKLDCLTFDSKGILPDMIPHDRDKIKEAALKKEYKNKGYTNIRVENFSDGARAFFYDVKNPISNEYYVVKL